MTEPTNFILYIQLTGYCIAAILSLCVTIPMSMHQDNFKVSHLPKFQIIIPPNTGPLSSVHHGRVAGRGRSVRCELGQPGLLQLHHLRWGGHVCHLRHAG